MSCLAYQSYAGSASLQRIALLAAGGLFAGGAGIMGPLYACVFGAGVLLIFLARPDAIKGGEETGS
jgi:hypothetical protein